MKKINVILASILFAANVCGVDAANLWIIGDATPYGWSLDDATALLSNTDNETLFNGTIYLKANADFKFMTITDWGGDEYGAAPDASLTDGKIALAMGTSDEGYGKIQVSEDGNYFISVDTKNLEATIVKSEYQESEIGLCSLFLVGDATTGGWSVDNGTPLFQLKETPYVFSADVELVNGTFKIATVIKGGGTWNSKYWYYCDPENAAKMILGNSDDTQWAIEETATYNVTANILQNTISIEKNDKNEPSGVKEITIGENESIDYFTIDGLRVSNPTHGLYIVKKGNKISKVLM